MILQPNLWNSQPLAIRSPVGVLYCILCVLGITAVFYPVRCRVLFQPVQGSPGEVESRASHVQIKGHHPDCQNFSGNRIKVGQRTFCAACTGLLIGATISLAGTVLYFFGDLKIAWGNIWLVALGEILMLAGLIQIRFAGIVKAMLNAFFVIGSFVTLVEVDSMGKSLLLDLYVFGLILFFLWFRISLSEWSNRRTCHNCQLCFR